MSQQSNVSNFPVSGPLRTQQRIEAACLEHTAFKPEDFENDSTLVVLEIGKEVNFDYKDLKNQPRTETLCHKTKKNYVNQCKEGQEFGIVTIFGIRKPIDVTTDSRPGRTRFLGLRGHHRYAAAVECKYLYIIARIKEDYWDLTTEQQLNYLNKDNAQAENGKPMTDTDIKNCFAQLLNSNDFEHSQQDRRKALQNQLDKCLNDEAKPALEKQIAKIDSNIKSRLAELSRGWTSGASMKKLKGLASSAYKSWTADHVTKMYSYATTNTEFTDIVTKIQSKQPSTTKIHASKATALGGVAPIKALGWGFITQVVDYKKKEKKALKKFLFIVVIPGASNNKNLFYLRNKLANDLIHYCGSAFPNVELEFNFLGQIRTEGALREEIADSTTAKTYDLNYVKEKCKELGIEV